MTIKDLQIEAHSVAVEKGWYDPAKTIAESLMMMVSELSEALEECRSGRMATWNQNDSVKPEGFGIELADCIIRIADTAEHLGIDLEKCIEKKMAYNKTRPIRHGGKLL